MRALRSLQEGVKEEKVSENGIRMTTPLLEEVKKTTKEDSGLSPKERTKSHRVDDPQKKTSVMKSTQKRAEKKTPRSPHKETYGTKLLHHEKAEGMEVCCAEKGTNSRTADTGASLFPRKEFDGLEGGTIFHPEDNNRAESKREAKRAMAGADSPTAHKRLVPTLFS